MTATASLGLRSNRRPCRSINKQTYTNKSKTHQKYKIAFEQYGMAFEEHNI